MRYSSHILVRVPPALPRRMTEAAKAAQMTRSEFARRAIERALSDLSRGRAVEARP